MRKVVIGNQKAVPNGWMFNNIVPGKESKINPFIVGFKLKGEDYNNFIKCLNKPGTSINSLLNKNIF